MNINTLVRLAKSLPGNFAELSVRAGIHPDAVARAVLSATKHGNIAAFRREFPATLNEHRGARFGGGITLSQPSTMLINRMGRFAEDTIIDSIRVTNVMSGRRRAFVSKQLTDYGTYFALAPKDKFYKSDLGEFNLVVNKTTAEAKILFKGNPIKDFEVELRADMYTLGEF